MSAVFSPCGVYRYVLTRDLGLEVIASPLAFVMLNPSTADAKINDPTIRRCISFAQRENASALIVGNVYALRSTDPAGLWSHPDPVGPENDQHLRGIAHGARRIVCAWGANVERDRERQACDILREGGAELLCLGVTAQGFPRHPLYVRGDAPLVPFSPRV